MEEKEYVKGLPCVRCGAYYIIYTPIASRNRSVLHLIVAH